MRNKCGRQTDKASFEGPAKTSVLAGPKSGEIRKIKGELYFS